MVAPSDQEFDFDDQIVSSKVYRKFLAQAMAKGRLGRSEVTESGLADISNDTTLKARQGHLDEARPLEDSEISSVDEMADEEPVSRENNP